MRNGTETKPFSHMKKSLVQLSFVAVLLAFASMSASAQALYFYLNNNTGKTFTEIYVSPSESDRWGYNLIPYSYLYSGYQTRIDIPSTYGSTCFFDLKVVTTDGTWYKFTELDVCRLYRITVHWNWTYTTEWE